MQSIKRNLLCYNELSELTLKECFTRVEWQAWKYNKLWGLNILSHMEKLRRPPTNNEISYEIKQKLFHSK